MREILSAQVFFCTTQTCFKYTALLLSVDRIGEGYHIDIGPCLSTYGFMIAGEWDVVFSVIILVYVVFRLELNPPARAVVLTMRTSLFHMVSFHVCSMIQTVCSVCRIPTCELGEGFLARGLVSGLGKRLILGLRSLERI